MRPAGLAILILGFALIVFQCINISMITYSWDMWHMQNLPENQEINRQVVSNVLTDIKTRYDRKFRNILIPASMMMAGGVLIYLHGTRGKNVKTPNQAL